jgi:hypothetical protein
MKISRMIAGIGILIIIILIVKLIVIPVYIVFSANINIVKYDNCTNVIMEKDVLNLEHSA